MWNRILSSKLWILFHKKISTFATERYKDQLDLTSHKLTATQLRNPIISYARASAPALLKFMSSEVD